MRKIDIFWLPVFSYVLGMVFLGGFENYGFWFAILAGFFLLLLGIGIWFFRWKNIVLWGICGVLFFLFGAGLGASRAGFSADDIALQSPGIMTLIGHGVDIQSGEEEGNGYLRGRLMVTGKKIGEEISPARGEVTFWLSPISKENRELWHDGNGMEIQGDLRIREQYRNPGPWLTWQEKSGRGIFRTLRAEGENAIRWNAKEDQNLAGWAAGIRDHFLTGMAKVMPEKDVSLLRGLLFGGREGISPELSEQFSAVGLTHILSVSGTHLSAIFVSLLWLGSLLRIRRLYVAILSGVVLIFYSLLCGFPPPVVRSLWMALGVVLAVAAERERGSQRIFALTMLGMLVWEPRWLYDISFQLSVAATMGLVLALPYLEEKKTWKNFWQGPFLFTLGSQMMSLPFMAAYFQGISLIAFVSNLLLLPIFEASLLLGLLGSVFTFLSEGVGQLFWILSSLVSGAGLEGVRILAKFPWAVISLPSMGFWSGIVYYIGIGLLLGASLSLGKIRIVCSVLGIAVLIGLAWKVADHRPSGFLEIHVIDVGQGDSIFIRTPQGKLILIDTGGIPGVKTDFDMGERVVAPYLWDQGVRRLDLLVFSHGDGDHAGGGAGVLKRIPASTLWLPESMKGHPVVQAAWGKTEPPLIQTPKIGDVWTTTDGVQIRVVAQPPAKEKSWSQVIEVTYGGQKFLFVGDLDGKEEKAFLQSAKLEPVTFLKVGHHGSKNGSSAELLKILQPKIAFISVGEANRFGHPTIQTFGRLKNAGSKIYRTDLQGRILIRSDGSNYWIETMSRQETEK